MIKFYDKFEPPRVWYDAEHYQKLGADRFGVLSGITDVDEWVEWAAFTARSYQAARTLAGVIDE